MTHTLTLYRIELPLHDPIRTGHGEIQVRPTILIQYAMNGREFWSELPAFSSASFMPETHASAWATLCDMGPDINAALFTHSLDFLMQQWTSRPLLHYALDLLHGQTQACQSGQSLMAWWGISPRMVTSTAMVGVQSCQAAVQAAMNAVHAAGYSGIKFKLTPASLAVLLPMLPHALTTFDYVVVDANGTFDASTIDQLHEIPHAVVIEQPTHDLDLFMANRWPHQVVLDESIRCVDDIALAQDLGVGVMLKPVCLGGVRPTIAMIEQCHERGVPCGVSGYLDSGVGRYFQWVLAQHEQLTLPPDFVWSNYYFSDDVLMVGPDSGVLDSLVVDFDRYCVERCSF